MLFYDILSGHRLNVVSFACADCVFFSNDHCGNLFLLSDVQALYLISTLYTLEKGKHHLGVGYCSKYFCNLFFSLSEKVLKDCIALVAVGVNQISYVSVFWQENNLNVKV